jgi:DNA polymerase-1
VDAAAVLDWARGALGSRGELLALAFVGGAGFALAAGDGTRRSSIAYRGDCAVQVLAEIESERRPRWLWWDSATASPLVAAGLRLALCWDLAAVHRLIFGGWRADAAQVFNAARGLSNESAPATGQLDLLAPASDDGGDPEDAVQPDGYLRPSWLPDPANPARSPGWQRSPRRWQQWAVLAGQVGRWQGEQLRSDPAVAGRRLDTARSESAAALLCVELASDGVPFRPDVAETIISGYAGPRARDDEHARLLRAARDEAVLRHLPGRTVDLRSPSQVKATLAGVGLDVPDTRSWRLEAFRGAHPVIEALLAWRKQERFATTYGYDWIDRHVGADGRLRGEWTGCDGGAGRMTASAGLHSMPAELRRAVVAEPGNLLVRADLGQIEPRVLAAVSGDRALSAATQQEDMYAPVAERLGVDRPTAKVAVLAAMYGQTSGAAGEALRGMETAYPTAMRYLRAAYEAGRAGSAVRTHGGRTVRMWPTPDKLSVDDMRANLAARGRYARNAVIQGSAAEFFKAWAVTVRSTIAGRGGIVMCLHDELLLQAPAGDAADIACLLTSALDACAARWAAWSPALPSVRFVADVAVVQAWSQIKAEIQPAIENS